ncbi:MAG: hypothetical protein ABII64_09915 [Elusimicrobiota bacterium]
MESNMKGSFGQNERFVDVEKYNKVNLVSMAIGLLWVFVTCVLTSNNQMAAPSAVLFVVPVLLARMEYRAVLKGVLFLLLAAVILAVVVFILKGYLSGKIIGILFLVFFLAVFFCLAWFISKLKGMRMSFPKADERMTIISLKSEVMGLRVFTVIVVVAVSLLKVFKVQLSSADYYSMILAALFIFSATYSITFLKLNKTN